MQNITEEVDWTQESIYDENAIFEMSEKTLSIKKMSKTLARWISRPVKLQAGMTYKLSVRCTKTDSTSNKAVYAMVSMYDENDGGLFRSYANRSEDGKYIFNIKVPDDCKYAVFELGLKGRGCVEWEKAIKGDCRRTVKRSFVAAPIYIENQNDIKKSMKKIMSAIDKAGKKDVDLIVLSEMCAERGCGLPINETAMKIDGILPEKIMEKAKKYSTYIVVNFHERDGENIYNTSLLIDRNGNISGRYRKTHISFGEYEKGVSPGEDYPVFDTDFGRIGLLICWDAYFPEPARIMALNGAEVLVISTVGDPAFRHVARAMENGVYVVVSGSQYHNLNDCRIKTSKVIAPNGVILAQTNNDEDAAIAEIDLNDKKQIRFLSVGNYNADPQNIYFNEACCIEEYDKWINS